MAELTQQERLQPSLLDRLTDQDPLKREESRSDRVLSFEQLRKSVMRDLEWLLNTVYLESTTDLSDYPRIKSSVLNYGFPDLSGVTSSNIELRELERGIKRIIIDFEPRILQKSLRVKVVADHDLMDHNALRFQVHGELWAQPVPQEFYVKTDFDLECGTVRVTDDEAGGAVESATAGVLRPRTAVHS